VRLMIRGGVKPSIRNCSERFMRTVIVSSYIGFLTSLKEFPPALVESDDL